MTVATLRPDSTTPADSDITVTGAATIYGALNDNSDSSYCTLEPADVSLVTHFGDLTLPGGAVIKSFAARVRIARVTGSKSIRCILYNTSTSPENVLADGSVTVTWASPTTVTFATVSRGGLTDANADAMRMSLVNLFGSESVRVYEEYVDVTYVEQPTLTVDAPTGTLTDTNLPTITWTATFDSDGGLQTFYQVFVFDEATYTDGGFDVVDSFLNGDAVAHTDGAIPGATAIGIGADTSWTLNRTLPDGTYRAYVRVAQTVNGARHWSKPGSDWEYVEFEIDVDLPAVPTLVVVPVDAQARVEVSVSANSGDATTDYFEIEASRDGGATWAPIRVRETDGYPIANANPTHTVFDYEAANGTETQYRARAAHDYSGVLAYSDWDTDTAELDLETAWLKHPLKPALNMPVVLREAPAWTRAGRQGVLQALGSSTPLVVSDKRAPATGSVALRAESFDDQDALEALLDEHATLLLQPLPVGGRQRYVRVLNHEQAPIIGQVARSDAGAALTWETLEVIEVASPSGDVTEWPS